MAPIRLARQTRPPRPYLKFRYHPLLVVLEDLHWSDPASLTLLRHVAGQLDDLPILRLVIYRDKDVPLDLWAKVAEANEDVPLTIVEGAIDSHILEAERDGTRVRFVHALIRKAIFDGILPPRRRLWQRCGRNQEARARRDKAATIGNALGAITLQIAAARLAAADDSSWDNSIACPAGLTQREVEALKSVAEGLTDGGDAERLFISPRTVSQHRHSIYGKLGVSTRSAASRFTVERA